MWQRECMTTSKRKREDGIICRDRRPRPTAFEGERCAGREFGQINVSADKDDVETCGPAESATEPMAKAEK
jgi:hypothetical protein